MYREEATATGILLGHQATLALPPCERCRAELGAGVCPGCDERLCTRCWANADHGVCQECRHETLVTEDVHITTKVL